MWHDWGLDYQEGKGWYAVDERGIYTNDSVLAKFKNSQIGKTLINVANAALGTAYDLVYTDEKVEKILNKEIEERYASRKRDLHRYVCILQYRNRDHCNSGRRYLSSHQRICKVHLAQEH